MEKRYECYKLHFMAGKQPRQFFTMRGAFQAAERLQLKGQHGTICGYWYDGNGCHVDEIGSF